MGREATYNGELNGLGGSAYLFLPFYGISSCTVNVNRSDATNATGDCYASTIIPKVYAYDAMLYNNDSPAAIYGFPVVDQTVMQGAPIFLLSTVTTPRESMTGRVCAVSANLIPGNYTVQRLWNKYLMVPPAVVLTDTASPLVTPQENVGGGWSIEAWVFRSVAGTQYIYMETDAGVTQYLYFAIVPGGNITVGFNGGAFATSVAAAPLNAWAHVAVVYTGANLIFYINNVAGAAIAHTHAGGFTLQTQRRINHGSLGTGYAQSVAVYQYAIAATQIDRHYNEITGNLLTPDYYSGGVFNQGGTIGQGGTSLIVYSNTSLPGSTFSASSGIFSAILPLQGIGRIRVFNGIYRYEIHNEEMDV